MAVPSAQCRTLTLATGRAVPHDISAFRSSRTIRYQHQSRIDHLASHQHQLLELAHARITGHRALRHIAGFPAAPSARAACRRGCTTNSATGSACVGDAVPCQHGTYYKYKRIRGKTDTWRTCFGFVFARMRRRRKAGERARKISSPTNRFPVGIDAPPDVLPDARGCRRCARRRGHVSLARP